MTYSEILEILREKLRDVDQFAYESYDDGVLGLGEVHEIHQEGGEGEGTHWESVKHFKDHDVYIKVTGFYSSYHGTDFDDWESCEEVRPTQKTITVYE